MCTGGPSTTAAWPNATRAPASTGSMFQDSGWKDPPMPSLGASAPMRPSGSPSFAHTSTSSNSLMSSQPAAATRSMHSTSSFQNGGGMMSQGMPGSSQSLFAGLSTPGASPAMGMQPGLQMQPPKLAPPPSARMPLGASAPRRSSAGSQQQSATPASQFSDSLI